MPCTLYPRAENRPIHKDRPASPMTEPHKTNNRRAAVLDLALILLVIIAVKSGVGLFAWKFAGPISLLSGVIVATALLHRRGETWADLGLKWPAGFRGWGLFLPQVILVIAAFVAASVFVSSLIEPYFPRPETYEDRFEGIYQNTSYFLLWLSIAIIHGGFFEEMIYRGFFITRIEKILGGVPGRILLAIILAAVIFGVRHAYYQHVHGAIVTGAAALLLGILYVLFRRNLAALITAHALIGILNMVVRYTSET